MLFAVRMTVTLPATMEAETKAEILGREKAYSQDLQRAGKWPHIWRITGHYANLSVFDVADNEELHQILWNLPLFQYASFEITPLNAHPSDIAL